MSLGIILAKVTLWGLGGVILVLCGTMSGFFPVILNKQLNQQLVLTNDSKSYNLWVDTPIPMYFEIYLFNWTNPIETLENNEKPNFLQLGPYVFSENHKKEDLIWNTNETITFRQRRRWHFIPEMSKGKLSDQVTNVNVVAITLSSLIKKYVPPAYYKIVDVILSLEEKNMYVTKSVNELLFEGYDDKILSMAKKLEKILKIKLPFYKFGWFYNRNNSLTYDGVFNMKTGASGLNDLGEIVGWNYSPNSPSYPGSCGIVSGSSGELWPLNAATSPNIKIFATDICSSLTLKRDGESEIHNVKGSRFSTDKTVFDNGENVPENICYCSNNTCPATGARDVSICRGAPAFISLPHFYMADSSYTANISGMSPSPQLHNFHIVLEQVTSIPLEVQARLQINIRTEPIKGIKFYSKIPYAYIPMLWFDQRAAVTPSLAAQLTTLVNVATYIEPTLIALTILGAIMIIIGLVLWRLRFFSPHTDPPLLDTDSNT